MTPKRIGLPATVW